MVNQSKESRESLVQKALTALAAGRPYRTVEQEYGIARSTLHYRLKYYRNARPGRRRGLTDEQEECIVQLLLRFAKRGTPLTQNHLRKAIQIFCKKLSPERLGTLPFNYTNVSDYFLRSFRRRHEKRLLFVRPLSQENKRFKAVNAETLTHHFATVGKLVKENNIDASRIFNLDEVGVTPDKDVSGRTSSRRLFARGGSRDMVMNDYSYKHRVTMMPVVNAAGEIGPWLVVVKGTRIPYRTVMRNGIPYQETPAVNLPRGSVIATRAETGGVDSANFRSWAERFFDHVKDLTANGRKVLLVYDAYRAHISLEILEMFFDNDIIVDALPAHTSGKTQPLDVVTFSAFKAHLNRISCEFTLSAGNKGVDMFSFMALLREGYHL